MKRILLLVVLGLAGCSTKPEGFTLQPGEKIILSSPSRATLFRVMCDTDHDSTGRVVNVELPLTVVSP